MKHELLIDSRSADVTLVVLGSVSFLAALVFLPITHDAIWQLWVGKQLLHGAELYVDVVEVNPPLWFWLAVPLAALGEAASIGSRQIVVLFFAASIAVSLVFSPPRSRLMLLFVMVVLPLPAFGQREHFTLISSVPYAFLIAARIQGRPVAQPIAIAAWAALGFALKPYFIVVPLALEALLWAHGNRKFVRPETVTMVACAVAYAAAVFVFAPTYLSEIVPMLRETYGVWPGNDRRLTAAFVVAALGSVIEWRSGSAETRVMAVAALAFLPAFFLLGKGWDYHSIPARGFLFLAVAMELIRSRGRPLTDGLLAAAALLTLLPPGVYRNPFRAEMNAHLAYVPRGGRVAVMTADPMRAWPMVDDRGLEWASRHFAFWQLQAIALGRMPELTAVLERHVAEDLRNRPDAVIVDREPNLGPRVRALLPYGFLDDYVLHARTPRFETYILRNQHLNAYRGNLHPNPRRRARPRTPERQADA